MKLARMGTEVVIVCQNQERGALAGGEIIEQTRNPNVHVELADLSSMNEVRALAQRLSSRYPSLHALINNHAALFDIYKLSADTYFLLTNLLLDNLERGGGRIVNVSARVHESIDYDFMARPASADSYSPWDAYCQSKLANILFTYALARRLKGNGVTVNCLHPGVAQTLALKAAREIYSSLHGLSEYPPAGTLETAAATSLYLATSPEVEGVSGKYFIDCQPVPSSDLSYDLALQEKLWEMSSGLAKIEQRVVKSDMKRM